MSSLSDDVIYFAILSTSLGGSYATRFIPAGIERYETVTMFMQNYSLLKYAGWQRKLFSASFGFALAASVCHYHVFYSLVLALINCALYIAVPKRLVLVCPQVLVLLLASRILLRRYLGVVSFVISFAYLCMFRCADYVALPMPYKHANAVQLIMTLKVCSRKRQGQI